MCPNFLPVDYSVDYGTHLGYPYICRTLEIGFIRQKVHKKLYFISFSETIVTIVLTLLTITALAKGGRTVIPNVGVR